MNQFPLQCRRKLKGIQCQNKHIQGHYFCEDCITEVDEQKRATPIQRCIREIKTATGKIRCKNPVLKGERKCEECIKEIQNRHRFFPSKFNKDLIIDIRK